jgi:acetyl esterase/lipase
VVFAPTWHSSAPVPPSDKIAKGLEDVACAVRFARAKAPEYGGDPSRLLLVGHSAGGPFGAMITLAGDDFHGDCLVSEGSALPDAFVGLDGPYHILRYVPQTALDRASPEEWAVIDPYNYLDRQPIREEVRFYLLHGLEEELRQEGLQFQQALEAAGYETYLALLPGVDHMNMASAYTKEVVSVIVEAMR